MDNINPSLLWIHCNVCYAIYAYKERKFFLYACQHVLCEKCSVPATLEGNAVAYKCPFCKKSVRARQVGNDMPPHLKDMFHPEPWSEGLNNSTILKFQRLHRDNLFKHLMQKEKEYRRMEQTNLQLQQESRKVFFQMQQLRSERQQLEKRVRQIKIQHKLVAQKRKHTSQSANEFQGRAGATRSYANSVTGRAQNYWNSVTLQPHLNIAANTNQGITSFVQKPGHSFNL